MGTRHNKSTSKSSKKAQETPSTGGKIKRTDFPSNVAILANGGKNLIRTRIAFGDWVLDIDPGKPEWVWKIIKDTPSTVAMSSRDTALQGLKTVSGTSYIEMRAKLITYVRLSLSK